MKIWERINNLIKSEQKAITTKLHFKEEFDIQLFQDMIDQYGETDTDKIFVMSYTTLGEFIKNIDDSLLINTVSTILDYELVIDNRMPNSEIMFCEKWYYDANK